MAHILNPFTGRTFVSESPVIEVTVKRTTTKCGRGRAAPGLLVGKVLRVDTSTLVMADCVNTDGREFKAVMIQEVDSFGKQLGLIYYDFFVE